MKKIHKTFERALITGASSGLGYALAEFLASKNISLILTGRDKTQLEKLKASLSLEVIYEMADLAKTAERQKILHLIREYVPD
ncbi:MAG: SDR family NAD(P)-dependent oxidoreductase, partial [Chlamydiae bacterium]|nr:SDR family NAD(P)-dependent oxidoreductase [Chlamydiota bacterium]